MQVYSHFLFIIRKWGPRGSRCLKGSKRDPFIENKILEHHVQRDPNDFTSESSKGVCLKTTARLNLKRQVLNRINPNGFSINDLLNKKKFKNLFVFLLFAEIKIRFFPQNFFFSNNPILFFRNRTKNYLEKQ